MLEIVLTREDANTEFALLAEWLVERWGPEGHRGYEYDVRGTARDALEVRRAGA